MRTMLPCPEPASAARICGWISWPLSMSCSSLQTARSRRGDGGVRLRANDAGAERDIQDDIERDEHRPDEHDVLDVQLVHLHPTVDERDQRAQPEHAHQDVP